MNNIFEDFLDRYVGDEDYETDRAEADMEDSLAWEMTMTFDVNKLSTKIREDYKDYLNGIRMLYRQFNRILYFNKYIHFDDSYVNVYRPSWEYKTDNWSDYRQKQLEFEARDKEFEQNGIKFYCDPDQVAEGRLQQMYSLGVTLSGVEIDCPDEELIDMVMKMIEVFNQLAEKTLGGKFCKLDIWTHYGNEHHHWPIDDKKYKDLQNSMQSTGEENILRNLFRIVRRDYKSQFKEQVRAWFDRDKEERIPTQLLKILKKIHVDPKDVIAYEDELCYRIEIPKSQTAWFCTDDVDYIKSKIEKGKKKYLQITVDGTLKLKLWNYEQKKANFSYITRNWLYPTINCLQLIVSYPKQFDSIDLGGLFIRDLKVTYDYYEHHDGINRPKKWHRPTINFGENPSKMKIIDKCEPIDPVKHPERWTTNDRGNPELKK